jgi:hypothetical protein
LTNFRFLVINLNLGSLNGAWSMWMVYAKENEQEEGLFKLLVVKGKHKAATLGTDILPLTGGLLLTPHPATKDDNTCPEAITWGGSEGKQRIFPPSDLPRTPTNLL